MLTPKFWHVCAGKGGRDYSDIFLEHDVMFIRPGDGGPYPAKAYEGIGSLRRFHDKATPGDIVLMRRGADVIAIGVIPAAGYQHLSAFDDIYGWQLQHTRRVVWKELVKPLPLFASRPRMSRFGRVKNPASELVELARECKERELLALPDAPSAILSPRVSAGQEARRFADEKCRQILPARRGWRMDSGVGQAALGRRGARRAARSLASLRR